MSLTERSHRSIIGILERLEFGPTETILKLSISHIIKILVAENKNDSSLNRWDSGYDVNYLTFSIECLQGSLDEQVAELRKILTFTKTTIEPVIQRSVDPVDDLEPSLIPLLEGLKPLLGGLNNVMNQWNNTNRMTELEDERHLLLEDAVD